MGFHLYDSANATSTSTSEEDAGGGGGGAEAGTVEALLENRQRLKAALYDRETPPLLVCDVMRGYV